jgi:hypothetical protein
MQGAGRLATACRMQDALQREAGCRMQDALQRGRCDRHTPRGSRHAGPQAVKRPVPLDSRGQRPEKPVLVTIKHNAES